MKNFIKLTSLIILFLTACGVIGWIYSYSYPLLYLCSIAGFLFFIPILVLYYIRIKKGAELKNLKIVFNVFAWIFIAFLMSIYLL